MESAYMYYLTDKNIQLERARRLRDAASQGLSRTVSNSSIVSSPPQSPRLVHPASSDPSDYTGRKDSLLSLQAKMGTQVVHGQDAASRHLASRSDDSLQSASALVLKDGRPFLRNAPYPLPCDLAELHRQNLHTMLTEAALAGPICAPFPNGYPLKVLEVGCGSAYWTSTCHDHFASLGYADTFFTGMDIISQAPDLNSDGVAWTFVQHDLGSIPWPFRDGAFDYVMVKEASLAVPLDLTAGFMEECMRVLSDGGTLEIRDTNHVIRALAPQSGSKIADGAAKVYSVTRSTAFVPTQNRFLQEANGWMEQACNQRGLPYSPCENVVEMLARTSSQLHDISSRRVAIPLTELSWEASDSMRSPGKGDKHKCSPKSKSTGGRLTADQAAIRHTALMTTIQKIESLAPILREVSGKNIDEWSSWWANMVSSLVADNGVSGGECVESGAWWASKGPAPP